MSTHIELNTNLSTIEALHELAESSSKKVGIDPQVLKLLLIDHSLMFKALKGNSDFNVKEPSYRIKI